MKMKKAGGAGSQAVRKSGKLKKVRLSEGEADT